MKNKLSCTIIRDLLPMYVDGIESKETNTCVEEHLNKCDTCKKEYYRMCKVNNPNRKNNELDVFIKFKLRIMTAFILLTIISITCVSISMICQNIQFGLDRLSNKEIILMVALNIFIYFIPMISLLLCWIWKKVSYGTGSYNVSSSFFISLLIIDIYLIINLLFKYIYLLNLW